MVFARRFAELYEAAGNPPLKAVVSAADAIASGMYGKGRGSGATIPRVSDWRLGKRVPAKFEVFRPVALALINMATKRNIAALGEQAAHTDMREWEQLWTESTRRSTGDDETPCPYLGLTAYGRTDAELFFGRDTHIGKLADIVASAAHPIDPDVAAIVMLLGASGAGKSSLMHAGLIPALAARGTCRVVTLHPGSHPTSALVRALAEANDSSDRGEVVELVIVDQFEEVFTACEDEDDRESFLAAVHSLARRGSPRTVVVAAMRADFFGHCLDYPVLEETVTRRSHVLGPMRRAELIEAITRPAEIAHHRLDPGLADLVIDELCGVGSGTRADTYEAGALPLLSHAMSAAWQRRDNGRLTLEGYQLAGGVAGSVAATAEQAWSKLTGHQQDLARRLLLALVTIGQDCKDTRRIVDRNDLPTDDSNDTGTVLNILTEARLVTQDQTTVSLTHEIVLDAWPRLRGWINDDRAGNLARQQVESDAAEWNTSGRSSAVLLRGTRLARAREHGCGLSPTATVFLAASVSARRRRTGIQGVAALAGVVLLIVATALYVRSADTSRQLADSDFTKLLTEVDNARDSDPTLSAQLTLFAHRLRPHDPNTESRLLATQNLPFGTVLHSPSAGGGRQVDYTGDSVLAAAGDDGRVRLWNVSDPSRPSLFSDQIRHELAVSSIADDSGGTIMISGSADHTVKVWNVANPARPSQIATIDTGRSVDRVAVSPRGHVLAVATSSGLQPDDDAVDFWDISDPARPRPTGNRLSPAGRVISMTFGPDARMLATVAEPAIGTSTHSQLWNLDPAAPQPEVSIAGSVSNPVMVAFSPTDPTVAIADQERLNTLGQSVGSAVHLLHVSPTGSSELGEPLRTAQEHATEAVAISPDGLIMAASTDTGIRLYDLADPSNPTPLGPPLVGNSVSCSDQTRASCDQKRISLSFSGDSRSLAALGRDGDIQLWSLPPADIAGQPGSTYYTGLSFSGNLHRMVIGSPGRPPSLWDTSDLHHMKRLVELPALAPLAPGLGLGEMAPSISFDGRTVTVPTGLFTTTLFDVSDPAHVTPLGQISGIAEAGFVPTPRPLIFVALARIAPMEGQVWSAADLRHPVPLSAPIQVPGTIDPQDIRVALGMGWHSFVAGVLIFGGSAPAHLVLWDFSDPAHPKSIASITQSPSDPIYHFAISPDGHVLATAGKGTIRLWNISAHAITPLTDPIPAHNGPLQTLSISSSGTKLVTGGRDSTALLWDITDPAHPQRIGQSITPPEAPTWDVGFIPDHDNLIFAGADNGVRRIWDLDINHAIQRICSITRTMIPATWATYLSQNTPPDICQ